MDKGNNDSVTGYKSQHEILVTAWRDMVSVICVFNKFQQLMHAVMVNESYRARVILVLGPSNTSNLVILVMLVLQHW